MSQSSFDLTKHFPGANEIGPARELPPLPLEWTSLGAAFVAQARKTPDAIFVAGELTYGQALNKAVGLAALLSGKLGAEPFVGVMVPPTAATAVANIALTLLGKVAVNLNYTNQRVTDSAIRQCGITCVIVSSQAMRRITVKLSCGTISLEDLQSMATAGGADADLDAMLASLPGLKAGLDDLATILLSTGSTGEPKGIELTHRNILSNAMAIQTMAGMQDREVILGILPFFHSFGYTVTFWTMAVLGKSAVFHPNAIDPKTVGKLLVEHQITLMACTPSLMRKYLKRCTKEQFQSVRWLLLGSEKLQPELARDIQEILGITPVEGYGLTELGPLCSANVPMNVTTADGRSVFGNKLGSVGQPSPGTTVRIVSLKTGEILPPGSPNEGVIFVHGPQVMRGYLNKPGQTAAAIQGGWLCTGDVGYIDEDGFLYITDRLSRFAKIASEMVPIGNVEAAVRQAAGVTEEKISIVAIPDEERGERLIVLYTSLGDATVAMVLERINATDMTKLWIPKAPDFFAVAELPISSTGKLDLQECKRIALKRDAERDGR